MIEKTYEEVINSVKNYIFIDLRSPKEFCESSIPKSFNVPIFLDSEREKIGKIYKELGVEQAKNMGIEMVSKRLLSIYLEIKKISHGRQIIMFCARGGLRSGVISSTLSSLGLPIIRLKGGYKEYRNYVISNLEKIVQDVTFITLFGKTGVGKTNILKILRKKNIDVLDLEKYANHRGSLLGSIGLGEQNSQKNFENLIFESIRTKKSKIIFVEGESKKIGKLMIPSVVYDKIHRARSILIQKDLENRIQNIKNEYIKKDTNYHEVETSLMYLEKYLGKSKIKMLLELLYNKKIEELIKNLILDHYDKVYKTKKEPYDYYIKCEDDEVISDIIIKIFIINTKKIYYK